MNAQAFLRHVEHALPSRTSLEDYGLDDEEIEEIRSTFLAPKRGPSDKRNLSPLERMVVEFDCSKLELGLVRFSDRLISLPLGTCFGYCEADPLVLTEDGSVALCDHERPDLVHQLCAENADRFLDAMATFVSLRSEKAAWMGKVDQAADKCATAAGGRKYMDFFCSLCAFFQPK